MTLVEDSEEKLYQLVEEFGGGERERENDGPASPSTI